MRRVKGQNSFGPSGGYRSSDPCSHLRGRRLADCPVGGGVVCFCGSLFKIVRVNGYSGLC